MVYREARKAPQKGVVRGWGGGWLVAGGEVSEVGCDGLAISERTFTSFFNLQIHQIPQNGGWVEVEGVVAMGEA